MPDCEEQKFFAAGEQVGKPLPSPSCTTEPLRVPDELRRPPETPIPEPATSVPPVIMLHNRQVTLTCQDVHPQETIYGDAVTVTQGAYSSTYTLATLYGISKETLDYIVSEGLLDWIEEYLNTKAFGSMSVKQVAKKLHLTNKQASQLINEAIVIIERLNDLALTNAGTQISCYWLNEPQTENCPDGSVEGDNNLNPASVVAAGVVTSYLSQADADARAKAMAREALVCHWANAEQTASCADDMGMPDVPNDLHPVYPGLDPRQGTVRIAAGSFTYAAKTPSEDTATPDELRQFGEEAVEEANRMAKDYALSLLVCYYVNPAMTSVCQDATAGTVVKHTYDLTQEEMESDSITGLNKEAGTKTRYELIHRDASFTGGTRVKGQRVFVPEGYIVSTVSQEDATARAEAILTSLLECCFVNRAFDATCPPAQVLDNSGNPKKDAFGNDVYVIADDIPGSRLTVEAGTFYSCVSQEAADAMAESSIEGMLSCAYCSEVIPPTCVPTWVDVAATSGIVLGKDMEVWKKNEDDEWAKVEMHAGDTYVLALPLDIHHLTNPYTGEDEDITLWSDDATIGAPARYNCSADINVSNQLAELYAVTKATEGESVCEYKNKKVIVTCSGNDPFTQCPACKPSFPHDIEALPESADSYRASSADSVWPFMGWAEGVDRITGEVFVFGSARGNFPWDDVESFPNCATYLTIEKGLYISRVSVEEATLMAKVFATSLMNCVNTNPEIYLYCDMPGKPTVAIGTTWHPTPTGYLSTECQPRAGWPHIECTCAAVLLDYGHDEDAGVYAVYESGYITVVGQQDIPCSLPAMEQTIGDLYIDACNNESPMYRQYGQDGTTVEYGDFTVNGNYPQRIYMEPPIEVNYATLAELDPTLQSSGMTASQKAIITQGVMSKGMAGIGAQDGLKKIVPWWAFAKDFGGGKISMYKDGILPSYIGPAPPYYGVTPDMSFAPGSNVMRVSEMPGNGKSWSEVVTENNPVVIAARTIRKKNSTNYACWKEARDIGLSMLYCQYCASGPVIVPTPPGSLVPCCPDKRALNYCEQKRHKKTKQQCPDDTSVVMEEETIIKGGDKTSAFGAGVSYPDYAPDCMFLGDTLEEAIEKRECFVASITRVAITDELSEVECWYGNDAKTVVKPCVQSQYRKASDNNYLYWDEKTYTIPANTILSNASKASANAAAANMIRTFPAPVCIAQSDAMTYSSICAKKCTNMSASNSVSAPQGLLTSAQATTASLNEQLEQLLQQLVSGNCLAVSQQFSMECPMPEELGRDVKRVTVPKGLIIRKCDTKAGATNSDVTIEAYSMVAGMLQCPSCNAAQQIKCTTSVIEYKGNVLYTPEFEEKNPDNIVTYSKGTINACAFMCAGKYTFVEPSDDDSGEDSDEGSGGGSSNDSNNAKSYASRSPRSETPDIDIDIPISGSDVFDVDIPTYPDMGNTDDVMSDLADWIHDNLKAPDSLGDGEDEEDETETLTCTQEYMDKLAEALGASVAMCMVENSTVKYMCKKPSKGQSVTVEQAAIILDAHAHTKEEATNKAREIAKGATTCLLSNEKVNSPGCGSCNTSTNDEGSSGALQVNFIAANNPVIPKGTLNELVDAVEEGHEEEVDMDAQLEKLTKACRSMALSMQVCIADKFELKGNSTREVMVELPNFIVTEEQVSMPVVETTTHEVTTLVTVPWVTGVASTTRISTVIEFPISSTVMTSSVLTTYHYTFGWDWHPTVGDYVNSTHEYTIDYYIYNTEVTTLMSTKEITVEVPFYSTSTMMSSKAISIQVETVNASTTTFTIQHLVASTLSTTMKITGLPEYAVFNSCTPKDDSTSDDGSESDDSSKETSPTALYTWINAPEEYV